MQQHDSANTRVDVSMSTSSAATQDGPVIYNVDSIRVGAAAHFGAAAATLSGTSACCLTCYPTTRQARSRLDDALSDSRGCDWRVEGVLRPTRSLSVVCQDRKALQGCGWGPRPRRDVPRRSLELHRRWSQPHTASRCLAYKLLKGFVERFISRSKTMF
jgi:hypothetical protein